MTSPSDDDDAASSLPDGLDRARPADCPRRPLPALVVALVAGLVVGAWFSALPLAWVLGAAFALTVGAVSSPSLGRLLYGAVFMTGMAWMLATDGLPGPRDIRNLVHRERQHVTITVVVSSQPTMVTYDAAGRSVIQFDVHLEAMGDGEQSQPVAGRLRVRLSSRDGEQLAVRYGDRWRLRGVLDTRDHPERRRGRFSGFLTVREGPVEHLASGEGNPVRALAFRMRGQAYERLGAGIREDEPAVALARALLLGYRQDVPRAVYDAFARTGTLHILALSGLHVGILTLLVTVLLNAMGLPRTRWILFLVPFFVLYTVGTGAAASTVRAAVMACVFYSAYALRRQPDPPSALALAALVILLADPYQLFDVGFILSFTVVGGLLLLCPVINARLFRPSREAVYRDPETAWWTDERDALKVMVSGLFTVSLAAWLASLPLIAGIFNLISPVALVVNIMLAPLAFVILLTSCLALGAGLISDWGASVFNHANLLFGEWLLALVDYSSRIPWGHSYVAAWPGWRFAAWYGLLLVWVVADRNTVRRVAVVGLLALVGYSISERSLRSTISLVALPTSSGAALLVDGPGRHALLVDAGSNYDGRSMVETLRGRGIDRLDELWLTRTTADAVGGLTFLLDAMPAGLVFAPEAPAGQRIYHERRQAWPGRVVPWPDHRDHERPGGLVLRVLHPPPGEPYRNARRSSLALHFSRGHRSLLMMGMAGPGMETSMLTLPVDWNAEVLLAAYVDHAHALSDVWLDAVAPKQVILSTAAFARGVQAPGPLLDRLAAYPGIETLVVEAGAPHHLVWP